MHYALSIERLFLVVSDQLDLSFSSSYFVFVLLHHKGTKNS